MHIQRENTAITSQLQVLQQTSVSVWLKEQNPMRTLHSQAVTAGSM